MVGISEAEAARETTLSGWLTQGPQVAAFEEEFAHHVGAKHACAVSNCTTALHLALLAVGVRPGDEVITVSHSFIATSNAIRYCGAVPVFVDITPDTFNLDPVAIEVAITRRTRAILCVHQLGMPCDLAAILALAHVRQLPVIEDAVCASGSEIRLNGSWERIGRPHGDIACFSFHPRKVITTGDGGMLTTWNTKWDQLFRLWRQHGMSIPDTARHRAATVIFEDYPVLGYNYRMTDVQAAIGRAQLERLSAIIPRRRALAERYHQLLQHSGAVCAPREPPWARSNWQSYCVRLPVGAAQRIVMQAMLNAGVSTRRGVMCAHLEPACASIPRRHPLTVSEQAQAQCILLPLFPQMTDREQEDIVEALHAAIVSLKRRRRAKVAPPQEEGRHRRGARVRTVTGNSMIAFSYGLRSVRQRARAKFSRTARVSRADDGHRPLRKAPESGTRPASGWSLSVFS
jgi:perosamine synthetase